ncbi:MAG: hypothetical protein AB8B96_10980 [Lysobacterales bacterium]
MKKWATYALLAASTMTARGIAQDIDSASDPAPQSDEPPPSMALLEFVALFETDDGKWMDLTEIPEQLDQDLAPVVPQKAPSEETEFATPASEIDAQQPLQNKRRAHGAN